MTQSAHRDSRHLRFDPGPPMLPLVGELCRFATGVAVPDNEPFFERLRDELPLTVHRIPTGSEHNGWLVPDLWSVQHARVSRSGELVFDAAAHPLGVGAYSTSFRGTIPLDELRAHVSTNPQIPEAFVYHCMWQYRPWDADWALSIPYETLSRLPDGDYDVDLSTRREPGDMLVADLVHRGALPQTIVFNAHTCHPGMANDDMSGVVVLVRLFQWLATQDTRYSYRLVLGPEHLGTVFYLRDRIGELGDLVGGYFAEMCGAGGPVKIASSFLGDQPVDRAVGHAAAHHATAHENVPWRRGAGNDETVWEAPGYEVPFVEVSRCLDLYEPYREYHTSLDTPDILDEPLMAEYLRVLQATVRILERNATPHRTFDGLVSLSNPAYGLYMERPDPSVDKDLPSDADAWGYLMDNLLRYFDGSTTILDIADRHGLPFEAVDDLVRRFEDKGLVRLEPAIIERVPISRRAR